MEAISRDALEWSLTHIERFGDQDFFPVPFEFAAIRHCWDRIRGELLAIDLERYRPHAPRRLCVPKPSGDFRIVSQLDPKDALLFTAMMYEASRQIESSRVPAEHRVACSYRINPQADGSLFADRSGWPDFHTRSQELSESGNYGFVLVADITDFYNQASQHRIENALELAGITSQRAKACEAFLSALAARQSRGLPVGPAASIALAEACLNDVDVYLLRRGLAHTRYVDDFRIFCRDYSQAIWTLHDLSDYLYTAHRLALNSRKTRILTCEDFVNQELLDPEEQEERGRLDRLNAMIEQLMSEAGGYDAIQQFVIDDDDQNAAVRDNIASLFEASLQPGRLHLGILRHLLRRASHLRTTAIHNHVFSNLRSLTPVLRDVALYIRSTRQASVARGGEFMEFLENDDHGQIPFTRLWGLDVICNVRGIVDFERAMRLAESSHVTVAVRCAALIAREAGYVEWVRERKENWSNFGPWERRAIIYSARALPRDERNAWLSVVEESGESLDQAVAQYVRANA